MSIGVLDVASANVFTSGGTWTFVGKVVVPIAAAVITAAAAIVAAHVSVRNDRRDIAAGITRDLDIIKHLDDCAERRKLKKYVDERVCSLLEEREMRDASRRVLVARLSCAGLAIGLYVGYVHVGWWHGLVVIAVALVVLRIIFWGTHTLLGWHAKGPRTRFQVWCKQVASVPGGSVHIARRIWDSITPRGDTCAPPTESNSDAARRQTETRR